MQMSGYHPRTSVERTSANQRISRTHRERGETANKQELKELFLLEARWYHQSNLVLAAKRSSFYFGRSIYGF